jgi:putative membrane protein
MKRTHLFITAAAGVIAAGAMAPAWAVSLTAGPAQPIPDASTTSASFSPIDAVAAGSAALVPLMATDAQANQMTAVDAPATGGSDVGKPIDDITFVRKATESAYKEVNSAKEAIPQLTQPELKRIAEMLVTDHSAAKARLAKLAEGKHWPVPPAPATAAPPSGTASTNFDATWTAEMIAGHERSVAMYRAQAQSGEDSDLRKYARETLPTIEHHLAELRRLQK